jgi:transposase-like protein
LNNRPSNIAIGSPSDNMMDMRVSDRVDKAKKAAGARRCFSKEQAIEVCERYASGVSLKTLAREYGVANATISYLINGRTYPEIRAPRKGKAK